VAKALTVVAISYIMRISNAIQCCYDPQESRLSPLCRFFSAHKPIANLLQDFERILIKRLFSIHLFQVANLNHVFGFRSLHNGNEQVRWVVNHILKAFETKKYCCGVFIDVMQALNESGTAAYSLSFKPFFFRRTLISFAHFLLAEPSRWMFEDLSLLQGLSYTPY